MFAIYVNDTDEGVCSYINLFADDAKLLQGQQNEEDSAKLQQNLDKIWDWSLKWEMEFNVKKCSVMEFGTSKNRITSDHKLGNEVINKQLSEKDLGGISLKKSVSI